MVKLLGFRLHGDRLRRLHGPRVVSELADALEEGIELMANEARESIKRGAVSGPGHVPSLPGEPPNADTHELDESIRTEVNRARLLARATADANYAAAQEFGTSELPARPYMRPAGQKMRPSARKKIKDAINRVNRGV